MKGIVAAVVLMTLFACASSPSGIRQRLAVYDILSSIMDSTMTALEGQELSDALAYLGPYDQEIDDGKDGRILIWRKTSQLGTRGKLQSRTRYNDLFDQETTSIDVYIPPMKGYESWRMVWVDPEGIIYRTAWKGL